jgi:hypothetical protein
MPNDIVVTTIARMIMDHSRRDRMAGFLKLARGRMVLDPRSAGLVGKSWSASLGRQVLVASLGRQVLVASLVRQVLRPFFEAAAMPGLLLCWRGFSPMNLAHCLPSPGGSWAIGAKVDALLTWWSRHGGTEQAGAIGWTKY